MQVLEGLLYINEKDIYKEFGAFLTEDESSKDQTNYNSLLQSSEMKEYVSVDFREENGEKLPDELLPRYKARDITLYFAQIANTKQEWRIKQKSFQFFLNSGWLNIYFPELDETFRVYVKKYSKPELLTPLSHSPVAWRFKVVFREPNPTF